MNTKVRTAIIGTGKASHMHAAVLKKNEQCEFVAVCSRDINKAKTFAASYGIDPYSSITDMVSGKKVDMVIVCTPHPYHKDVTVEAITSGAHVLVEKPLAASLPDCDAMIAVANRSGKKLGVIGQRRFFPAAKRCRQVIDQGRIGRPMIGTITMLGWRDEVYYASDPWRGKWDTEGGGVLVNQAPHQLDLLLWYMGSEPEELFGIWKNINHPYIEVEDTAVAILKFKNGALANILVSNSQKPGIFGKVHVHGSNGASVGVQTEAGAMFIAGVTSMGAPPSNDLWTIPGEEDALKNFEREDAAFFTGLDPIFYSINEQHLDFINAIKNDHEPMINGIQGRKSVELFTAIYQSTRTGTPVRWPL
jgi:UDP-N-acetyl-2-amino-2-deoxyglucuronate dehydrogenase